MEKSASEEIRFEKFPRKLQSKCDRVKFNNGEMIAKKALAANTTHQLSIIVRFSSLCCAQM
jgi:hypothetical protein